MMNRFFPSQRSGMGFFLPLLRSIPRHRSPIQATTALRPTNQSLEKLRAPAFPAAGFTLVELVISILVLGILAAVALPIYADYRSAARAAAVKGLGGSVNSAMGIVNSLIAVRGAGTAGKEDNITWVTMTDGSQVRVWSGYPDRWCDGIGATQLGMEAPASDGCYLSTAAVKNGQFNFYGYGNGSIPNGDAGWRLEDATDPMYCSVQYTYNGTTPPVVTLNTKGC